ncbi:BrnT family toxin [Treponema endosymbiont of Eucomonympha sp.]|uniref:BrnT family toxin n=1 Tax=Treponema endosymbiont of Eucomonympha sp. TaxID=1580831 RepID=UPI000782C34A|nr:BrnT family toxin [Treponema endosymbiont of Eucomonympha sp.]
MTRQIEFDPDKEAINWKIHKIHLSTAALVFGDSQRIERADDSEGNTTGEARWQTLGMAGKVLFVVYTERGENTRIISARTANRAEKRSYYGHDNANNKQWAKAD